MIFVSDSKNILFLQKPRENLGFIEYFVIIQYENMNKKKFSSNEHINCS